MNSFVVGQCWSSEAEPELGLGNLLQIDGRRITMHFHGADATRVYAMDTAPLRRVSCKPGEAVVSKDGMALVISRLQERNGVIFYSGHNEAGQEVILPETELQVIPERNRVEEALKFGDFDRLSRFQLRAETLHRRQIALSSPLRGLGCNRTALLPHQLYLADEIGSRHAPRVLLADEVGLGKTIEAGMVLQRQLQAGRVNRVLILLSENLQHQWLVEMLRRFNLRFALFDRDRFEDSDWPNPMLSEQLVITSLELLQSEPEYALHACDGEWDLLVVDEAHRLGGMEPEPSPAFSLVAALSGLIPAVLLLTATPEQLGQHAHFDRLRLLDPDRFHDYGLFQQETQAFQQVAQLFDRLSEADWSAKLTSQLHQFDLLDSSELATLTADPQPAEPFRQIVRNRLLDRHGTGRLLFRNTRAAVGGFPERRVNHVELPLPAHYSATELSPERLVSDSEWWREDPRVAWLIDFIETDHQGKVLLICSEDVSARQLHDYLRLRTQVRSALFHGEMTVLQRDRAAAWFAEADGAQLMICSEIGSEGRNFQAASHLVLFDLPLNPELLEQRIGRIDRIGQGDLIELHLPLFDQGAQQWMWRWCDQALNILAAPSPAALIVFEKFKSRLLACCAGGDDADLIEQAHEFCVQERQIIDTGRDRLLELNSCRKQPAQVLTEQLQVRDQQDDLQEFLETLLPELGVEVEQHSEHCLVLRPGSLMSEGALPELPDEGVTVTFDRRVALQREDMLFLTDEHLLTQGAMEKWATGLRGLVAAAVVRDSGLQPGTLLLETLHVSQAGVDQGAALNRFFPPTLIREISGVEKVPATMTRLEPELGKLQPFVKAKQAEIETLLLKSYDRAEQRLQQLREAAANAIDLELDEASGRLQALRKHNPTVREDELVAISDQQVLLHQQLAGATIRLEGCCLLVVQN